MVNTVLSPLSPAPKSSPSVYAAELAPSLRQAQCQSVDADGKHRSFARSNLKINLGGALSSGFGGGMGASSGKYFLADFSGGLCLSDAQFMPIQRSLKLPIELLSEERLARIPVGFGYVVRGIPADDGGRAPTVQIKITRLPAQDRLQPFLIEWLPAEAGKKPASGALTIWMSPSSDGEMPIWRKVRFEDLHPALRAPLRVRGEWPGQTKQL